MSSAAAVEEHRKAADGFATAASDVQDVEVLRLLHLLEEHHRQLARIVESPHVQVNTASSAEALTTSPPSSSSHDTYSSPTAALETMPAEVTGQQQIHAATPTPPVKTRRDHSSSIANQLATARGINRNQQRQNSATSPPPSQSMKASAGNARAPIDVGKTAPSTSMLDNASRGETLSEGNSKGPAGASDSHSQAQGQRHESRDGPSSPTSLSEDSFSKFYSTLGGILSKVSAPLAFAGLPLGPDDPTPSSDQSKSAKTPDDKAPLNQAERNQPGSDINKLFSKAALRAIQADGNGAIPAAIVGQGVHDSFYHVPPSGGTMSYAGILSRAEQSARQQSEESHHKRQLSTNDEYVDARETLQPGSPTKLQRNSHDRSRKIANNKTAEELVLENETLRQLSDTLSKRLYMWETSAQNQSEALQASRMLRGGPNPTSAPGQAAHLSATTAQVADSHADNAAALTALEAQLEAAQKDMDKVGRENDKLRAVVARYRERWEKLKEGARVRRESIHGGTAAPEKT